MSYLCEILLGKIVPGLFSNLVITLGKQKGVKSANGGSCYGSYLIGEAKLNKGLPDSELIGSLCTASGKYQGVLSLRVLFKELSLKNLVVDC